MTFDSPLCRRLIFFSLFSALSLAYAETPAPSAPPAATAPAGGSAARVVTVVGDAAVGKKRLEVGDSLKVGDRVETGKNASVKLLMPDRTIVDIAPASAFTVAEYKARAGGDRDVTFDVDFGKVRASVNRKLEGTGHIQLRTKASVLAVRGTEFVVNVSRETNAHQQVVVVSGRVQVSALSGTSSVFVLPGNQWENAAQGGAGGWSAQVKPIEATQLNAFVNSARAEDNTFLRALVIPPSDSRASNNGRQTLAVISSFVPSVHAPGGPAPEAPPLPPVFVGPGNLTGVSTISNGGLPPLPPPGLFAPRSVTIRIH